MIGAADVAARVDEKRRELLEAVDAGGPLVVVKAPPGSGKSRLIIEAAALLRHRGQRVAIAGQTNSQVDDLCRRLGEQFPFQVVRFFSTSGSAEERDLGDQVIWVSDKHQLSHGPCIVVGTSAKWGAIDLEDSFDWLLVDEAWQLADADFMLLREVAPRFLLVGDPGQIAPVVTIDTARWATAPRAPHRPAPEYMLTAEGLEPLVIELPASRRLPHDSVPAVNLFYDFPFAAWSAPGDRVYTPGSGAGGDPLDAAIDLLTTGSMVGITLPTPPEGPPLEEDPALAQVAADLVGRMLDRGGEVTIDGRTREVLGREIGMSATHRVMNARMAEALPAGKADDVVVDTPERWLGLERPLMVIVHPVSGTARPSAFDLETGRLCVMASRHQVGLVVITRDHLPRTLEELAPSAEQHVGLPDVVGAGQYRHEEFWRVLEDGGRVVALDDAR
jgi:hypothetical protein